VSFLQVTEFEAQAKSDTLSGQTLKQYSIVCYNENNVIQYFAASELQRYLTAIFHVNVPVINKKDIRIGRKYFFLGIGFTPDSLNITGKLTKDSFIKGFKNQNIYLGGTDDQNIKSVKIDFSRRSENANFGTLYAVYDFLENDLGVHWFFPTYLGEYIPSQPNYYLREQVQTVKTPFEQRAFGRTLYHNGDTVMLWMLRNKITYLHNSALFKHNWKNVLPPKVFFDDDSSCFANIYGQRKEFSNNGRSSQLCTTNERTIELFIDQAKKYLKSNPRVKSFSLSPNDNENFCECDNCIKQDIYENISPKYSKMSFRIFSFYKTIYDSLIKYFPNIHMGGLAYKEYSTNLENARIPDDFIIRLAINNIGFGNKECSTIDTVSMIMESWENHNKKEFYCYPYGNSWDYPYLKSHTYQKLIKELDKNKFYQVCFNFYPDWYSQGLDIWLISKMFWNPDVNIDSLKTIYYKSVYPVSNNAIRDFHIKLEKRIANLAVCVPEYHPGKERLNEIFLKLFSNEFLNETRNKLELELKIPNLTLKERNNIANFLKMIDFLTTQQYARSSNKAQQ
jgi:hypothetical protein